MNKKILILGFVVILLLAGYLFIKNSSYIQYYVFHTGMPPGYCDPGPCNTAKTSGVVSQTETQGWKTYSNSDLGFQVQYPKDWIVSENPPQGVSIHTSDEGGGFNVTYKTIFDSTLGRNKTINDYTRVSGATVESINVGGVMGKQWQGTAGNFGKVIYVVAQKPNDPKIYQIDLEYYPDSDSSAESTLGRILSTLKFN